MSDAPVRLPHPVRFFFLFLPVGVGFAYVSVNLGWEAGQAKLSNEVIAGLAFACLAPHTWKFIWAPVVDLVGSARRWWLCANAVTCAVVAAVALVPVDAAHVRHYQVLSLCLGLATTVVAMSTEWLMAHLTTPEKKGGAAAWSQAGNVGGGLLGGLTPLLVGELGLRRSIPPVAVAAALAACSLALVGLPKVARQAQPVAGLSAAFGAFYRDLRSVFVSRRGLVALALCALPIGSAAGSALFAAMGGDWGASDGLVSMVNGLGAGAIGVVGSLAGGWVSDRMERRTAYVAAGLLVSLAAFGFALCPKTALWYALWVLAYYLAQGVTWSTWSGFVLGEIGKGAAATKYNLLAALATTPILVMTAIDGWAADRLGRVDMLWIDGGAGVVGAVLFGLVILAIGRGAARAGRAAPGPSQG
jgi:MFS family permease